MGQLGFFDLNRRYESLTGKNDPLVPGEATLTPLIPVRMQVPQPYNILILPPAVGSACDPPTFTRCLTPGWGTYEMNV
jgi:hypothetical protein